MKKLIQVILIILCYCGIAFSEDNYSLRSESETIKGGTITIIKTFRGNKLIMEKIVKNGSTSVCYFNNGKLKFIELDKNNDGFFEIIDLPGDDISEFERFRRDKEGNVEPISREEYILLKNKFKETKASLYDAIKGNNLKYGWE